MSFVSVLKSHVDNSCVMLYGSVTDNIISADLCYREFSVALHDILKECGYDNIVFFDFTRASGKYVYDDISAYYSIASAKEPYEKKYGSAPKLKFNACSKNSLYTIGNGDKRVVRRFGKQRKVVSENQVDNTDAIATEKNNDTRTNSIEIPYQQRNLDPSLFYGELRNRMMDGQIRSAFVFDLAAFLRDNSSLQNVHNILYQWRNPNNIIIFVNSDGKSIIRDAAMLQLLRNSGLYQYFCSENGKGDAVYREDRCFPILSPSLDEYFYSLHRTRLFNNVIYEDGIEEASDKINYLMHMKTDEETISLREFCHLTDVYLHEHSGSNMIGKEFYEFVCKTDLSDFDFHPLMKLYQRPGWSIPVEKMIEKIVNLCQELTGEICQSNGIEEKMQWLLRANRTRVNLNTRSVCTMRFGGTDERRTFPSSTALPHMMIIGRPGTGKTTGAMEIGRVFHDAGLLSIGHVLHIDGGSLQAGYVGQTPMRINELLNEAENGVLFIDEAYNLCKDYEEDGNASTFAEEAVNTLVNAMTDDNRHVLIIFSGYPSDNPEDEEDVKSVRGLYKMNPGLRRRIKIELEIEDYSPEMLSEIFLHEINDQGFSLSDDLRRDNILNYMQYHYQTRTRDFGNGDFAVQTAQYCIDNAKRRNDLKSICATDFGDGVEYLEAVTMEKVQLELNDYPGLNDVGIQIINDSVKLYQNRKKVGIANPGSPKHVILVGKRGTGKNTLANLLCKAWGVAGIMSGGKPVTIKNPASVSYDFLKKELNRSLSEHTALFIDEAHNAPETFIRDLLNPMTEYNNLTCIFAVYPERLEEFFQKDPGLRDRCMKPNLIPDYTPEQLLDIFKAICKKQKREADNVCCDSLKIYFEHIYKSKEGNPDYSNARMVKNLVEEMEVSTDNPIFTEADIPLETQKVISINRHTVPFENILARFDDYIGWKNLKEYLLNTRNLIKYKESNPEFVVDFGHVIFAGNPGTGKTEAGKLFAEACYSLGIVRTNRFCQYGAEDLISEFMGQTRIKAKSALQRGVDGVILIDEAYNLSYNDRDSNADYKREAVDILLRFSNEQVGKTIIILAGYEDKIKVFLQSNKGLGGRFSNTIFFDDFSADECFQILEKEFKKNGLKLSENLQPAVCKLFDDCICNRRNWGNARDVKSICKYINQSHVNRVVGLEEYDNIITLDDINTGFEAWTAGNISG